MVVCVVSEVTGRQVDCLPDNICDTMSLSAVLAPIQPPSSNAADRDAQSVNDSAPESLDLDYDDWEGQFEFVGPGRASTSKVGKSAADDGDDSDDLNLSVFVPNAHQPVLYDEETFLSLNPNDFLQAHHSSDSDDIDDDDDGVASADSTDPHPHPSIVRIADCRTSMRKKSNLNGLNNRTVGRKFVSAKYHAEELNNIKNRLLADELSNMKGSGMLCNNNNNNGSSNNNNNSELAADLCDNLTEQVGLGGRGKTGWCFCSCARLQFLLKKKLRGVALAVSGDRCAYNYVHGTNTLSEYAISVMCANEKDERSHAIYDHTM